MFPQPVKQLHHLQARWVRQFSSPAWYLSVIPEMQSWTKQLTRQPVKIQDECKAELYDFFERHLIQGDIALDRESRDWDSDRKPIDTVVIHHTSNPPGLRPERLSAIGLIRLYAPYFASPTSMTDKQLKGRPIYSGHERENKQVFWPYHWIIRRDGRAERLLHDWEIGWQAGDWDVNCRSVAIVLDNDHEWRRPSDVELRSIAALIADHYVQVPLARIVGHREVNLNTTCPSNLFLNLPNGNGWKNDLLTLLAQYRRAA